MVVAGLAFSVAAIVVAGLVIIGIVLFGALGIVIAAGMVRETRRAWRRAHRPPAG